MRKLKSMSKIALTLTMLLAAAANADDNSCDAPYSDYIVQYADEHNPHNRILTLDYDNMELLNTVNIEGVSTHHADPMGTLDEANYMMLVSKGSYFVTIWDIKSDKFIKKINLPFRPRSADAYNKQRDLVLLNSRDRPAAVLIDATKLKMVGRAGFNIECNHEEAKPIYNLRKMVFNEENFDKDFKCYAPDFGGDQISGHPIWLNKNRFAILDRANRAIEVYKIKEQDDGLYSTKLVQVIRTNTSMHQMIPLDKDDPNNKIFFGMTEGNKNLNIAPRIYKFKLKRGKLKLLGYKTLYKYNTEGMGGHNLYITPDKKYLYAPLAAQVIIGKDIKDNFERKKILKKFKHFKWLAKFSKKFREFVEWKGISYYQKKFAEFKKLGKVFVVSTKNLRIKKVIEAGFGAGHVAFSKQRGLAVVTNHLDNYVTVIDYKHHKFVKNINLDFEREGIFNLTQSHMQHVSDDGEYYYNFWSDGGEFFRIDLEYLRVDNSVYVGGVPIQGNFYKEVHIDCDPTPPDEDDGYDEIFDSDLDLATVSKRLKFYPYPYYSFFDNFYDFLKIFKD